MATTVKIEGLKELDRALGELTKATARNVLRRVAMKAGQPIADAARAKAPRDSGELAESIAVSSKVKNNVGKSEYAGVLSGGGTKEAAVAALRSARRAAAGQGSFAEVYVGPTEAKTKKDAIKRIVQEFGSATQSGQPYMRPAWDGNKNRALDIIKDELAGEIEKAAKRQARKQARLAAKAAGG